MNSILLCNISKGSRNSPHCVMDCLLTSAAILYRSISQTTAQFRLRAQYPSNLSKALITMSTPPIYVQVARRKQIFTFLMDSSDTVADILTKVRLVSNQHDIPEASEDAQLIVDNSPVDAVTTLSSLMAQPEGLMFHLVYALNDNEYEPVEVEPTKPVS